ncbi:MAG: dUTP diphosphatase [Clostridiales bacterium]|nr:dUTP diphosphatase [Clostridiales bacterium]
MEKLKITFKKLDENAVVPSYGSEFAAGADLYSLPGDVSIAPGQTVIIHTGLSFEIPEGYGGFIFARSGLATKKGLAPANKVGVIDSDYRGEIMVALHNSSGSVQTVSGGERIAQIVFLPYAAAEFLEADTLGDTKRGIGGFGSTGTN